MHQLPQERIHSARMSRRIMSYVQRGGGVFTIANISKAFDTVSHSAIKPCLARKSVPIPIIGIIKEMYKGCKTKIQTRNNAEVEIKIFRGVKLGDPLSQLLFNLRLEALLDEMEEKTSGTYVNDIMKVPILPFADDIVLLGEDDSEAQCQVDALHKYQEEPGYDYLRGEESNVPGGHQERHLVRIYLLV